MNAREPALEKWLRRLEKRSPLTQFDRETVRNFSGRTERFAASQDVVSLGERTTHSCLVADGVVARFGQTSDGLRQLSAVYIPGDMADLHSAVLPRVSAPLQSAAHSTVVFVPHSEIIAAGEKSATLARAFWRDCVADAQVASEWMLNNGRRNARARIAHLLCELSFRYAALGENPSRFPVDLTQTHLADATGLTAVHVNRSLRSLRELDLVEVKGRTARIFDLDGLGAIADFDPAYLHLETEVSA